MTPIVSDSVDRHPRKSVVGDRGGCEHYIGGPIGLYVHIPFCTVKCDYCSFFSVSACSRETVSAVIDTIIDDAKEMLRRLGHPVVRTVYIGGGTPSVLDPTQLRRLGEGVARACGRTRFDEWTIEANPETSSSEWVDALYDLPVTRVSVGVQSFRASVRGRIGRAGEVRSTHRLLERLRKRNRQVLGIDLLAGYPSQTTEQLVDDVRKALFYAPEHMSIYPLTLEPGTPLARRVARGELSMPDDDATVSALEAARRLLCEANIFLYEVSNYAHPGYECRHNDGYWRLEPYLGVGPGAVSTLPAADGTAVRLRSYEDIHRFLRAEDGPRRREREHVERRSFILEHFMLGLRRSGGLSVSRMHERFGADPTTFAPGAIERWESAGLAERNKDTLSMTSSGRWVLDAFLREIASELASSKQGSA